LCAIYPCTPPVVGKNVCNGVCSEEDYITTQTRVADLSNQFTIMTITDVAAQYQDVNRMAWLATAVFAGFFVTAFGTINRRR